MPVILPNLKSILSSQLLRVATLGGQRFNTALPAGVQGAPASVNHGIDPLGDNQGKLIVRNSGPLGYSDSLVIDTNVNTIAQGYAHTLDYVETYDLTTLNLGWMYLQQIYGFNINPAVRFLQLVDVLAPNEIPIFSILVPPNTNYSLTVLGDTGLLVDSPPTNLGKFLVSSTSGNEYIPSGTDDFWINIIYRSSDFDPSI